MVYNADDEMVTRILNETEHKGERLAWSVKKPRCCHAHNQDRQATHTHNHTLYI